MLSFATEFPVDAAKGLSGFVHVVKAWILASPHTPFSEEDLREIPVRGEWKREKEAHKIEVLINADKHPVNAAFRHSIASDDMEWITDIVYSKDVTTAWIGVRVARESAYPVPGLPEARRPVVVGMLLSELGGAYDGLLQASRAPHFLQNDEIALASQIIRGESGCHLPTVYVSSKFSGGHFVDCNALANDLAGMAHVVVEPNRAFSVRLQIEVASKNAYGGVIGLYWPDGSGGRVLFNDSCVRDRQLKARIFEEIRSALRHRRPLYQCTRASVMECFSRAALDDLRRSKSVDLESYIKHFDEEVLSAKEKLSDAEKEISRLKAEVRRVESMATSGPGVFLSSGGEQEFFQGEFRDFIIEAVALGAENAQDDSRAEHVLRAIASNNESSGELKFRRESLKSILREYRSMNQRTREDLISIGFSISGGGKHLKLTYNGDERYTFTLPKSGSDYRGGLNAASDIAKRLF